MSNPFSRITTVFGCRSFFTRCKPSGTDISYQCRQAFESKDPFITHCKPAGTDISYQYHQAFQNIDPFFLHITDTR